MLNPKGIILFIILLFCAHFQQRAQNEPVLSLSLPSQNNLKYNRFLQNPTFSFVGGTNTNVAVYHRNQWIGFNDSPKTYFISYSGTFTERTGLGFGLYQQNLGVITSFGALANYAYNVKLNDALNLTVGFNMAYYSSGINKNKVVTTIIDPAVMNMANGTFLTIQPGVNLNYKQFDFGIYAENLVDFNFKSTRLEQDQIPKSIVAHAMYTTPIQINSSLLEQASLQGIIRTQFNEVTDFSVGGGLLLNAPKTGWLQTGFDNFYGFNAGLGFHLSKRLSIGYTYEKATKQGLSNFGSTHEFNIAFAIKHENNTDEFSVYKEEASILMDENEHLNSDLNKDDFIADVELELDEYTVPYLENILKTKPLTDAQRKDIEERIKNLKIYTERAERIKNANKKMTPIVLRNMNAPSEKVTPKTVDDLKDAENGYYLISTPINQLDSNSFVNITRYDGLIAAVKALNEKTKAGQDKDLYIIHVDNPAKIENTTETKPNQIKENQAKNKQSDLESSEDLRSRPASARVYWIKDVPPGFYIIANVFEDYDNATNFMKELEARGLEPAYFVNPANNYIYVYLNRLETKQDAVQSFNTNVNHLYNDEKWIMSVNTTDN